jgi:protein-tyrosine-phosphatase
LAHHLDVLESVGAIERTRSAGDARRRYVRLGSAALEVLGTAPAPIPREVLFLCTRNSARSQLAAALWRERTGCRARSAGTRAADKVHPGAIAAGRRAGLSLAEAVPTNLRAIPRGVQVITVCDLVHEELEAKRNWWHWSISDPVEPGRAEQFDASMNELEARIARFVGARVSPTRTARSK